jgi:TctA family transporter
MPTWPEFKRIIPSALRGSVIGSLLGILPGGGPVIAQFAAYALDKKVSKYKTRSAPARSRAWPDRRRPTRRRRAPASFR